MFFITEERVWIKEDILEKDFIDELRAKNGNLEIAICNAEINNEL